MPLKIHPPRKGSKFPIIRGTYRKQRVYRTVETHGGATPREARAAAQAVLRDIEREIDGRQSAPQGKRLTWAEATMIYLSQGGDDTYLEKLNRHFDPVPIDEIDQTAVDAAAHELCPGLSNATKNRQIYTPVSAVLRAAAPERGLRLRRPKMGKGRVVWLEPEEVGRLVEAAAEKPRLRALIVFLTYTGCRISEALSLEWDARAHCRVILEEAFAWVAETKTDEPRGVHLPPVVVAELRAIREHDFRAASPGGFCGSDIATDGRTIAGCSAKGRTEPGRAGDAGSNPARPTISAGGRVFGYPDRWVFYDDLKPALKAAGITLPVGVQAHVFRHTWATWMRRAGYTPFDLVDAGVWKDIRSAMRYQHVVSGEAARGADKLPVVGRATLVHDDKEEKVG